MGNQSKKNEQRLVVRCTFSDTEEAFEIDIFKLTVAERIELEEAFDEPWLDIWQSGWLKRSTKGAAFIGYLARKRRQPDFTLAQAIECEADSIERSEEDEAKRPTGTRRKAGSRS